MNNPEPTFAIGADATNSAGVAERILTRTRGTQNKLLPRLAVVARALAGVGREVDCGLPADLMTAPLSLKSAVAIEGLQAAFNADPALVERVAATMARYKGAADTLDAAEPDLQELKSASFFISRFHEAVKDDMLLAQLFPAPQVLQAQVGDGS